MARYLRERVHWFSGVGRAWGHPSQSGSFRIASKPRCFDAKGSDETGGTVETLPCSFASSSFRARSVVFAFRYRVPRVDGSVRCSVRLRSSSVVLADGSTVLPASDETAAVLSIVPGGWQKGSDETDGAVETVECCFVCCIHSSVTLARSFCYTFRRIHHASTPNPKDGWSLTDGRPLSIYVRTYVRLALNDAFLLHPRRFAMYLSLVLPAGTK